MTTTVTIEGANIIINSISLEELLHKVYQKGKQDALFSDEKEKITFIQLSKELAEKGRKISVQTLTKKARAANVKILNFDGKRLAIYRKDIKFFLSI
jgi:hypothetical protein